MTRGNGGAWRPRRGSLSAAAASRLLRVEGHDRRGRAVDAAGNSSRCRVPTLIYPRRGGDRDDSLDFSPSGRRSPVTISANANEATSHGETGKLEMPVVAASLAGNTIKRVSNCGNVTSESQIFSNPSSRSQKDTLKTERLGNISCGLSNIVGTYSTGDIVIPSPKYIFNKSSTCNSVRLDMTPSGIVFMLVPCRYKNLSLMRNPRHLGTSDIEKLYDKLRYSKFVKEHSSSGIFSSLFQLKSRYVTAMNL
uniref:Uncharacterized protein n=1 Tax=Oryza nivara TaxID=4536 RepID=A0A0E0INS6_ORYNI